MFDAGPRGSMDAQFFEGRLPFGNAAGPVLATLLFRAGGVNLYLRQEVTDQIFFRDFPMLSRSQFKNMNSRREFLKQLSGAALVAGAGPPC